MNHKGPKVGQWLYASCSAEHYGQVIAVGKDDNNAPTIDICMEHSQDLIDCEDSDEPGPSRFQHPLTYIELPEGVKPILRGVQYHLSEQYDDLIVCNTPGNGCYRCTKLFSMHDEKVPWAYDDRLPCK